MKKLFAFGLGLAVLFLNAACGSDDSSIPVLPNVPGGGTIVPTDVPSTAGSISSGTALDNLLPVNYRIASIGGLKYGYDENGKLITVDGEEIKNGVITGKEDGDTWTEKLSCDAKGLLVGHKYLSNFKDDGYSEKGNYTTKLTYNANNQLNTINCSFTIKCTDGVVPYTWTGSSSASFHYDGMKLVSIKYNAQEAESYMGIAMDSYSGTYDVTFNYDNAVPNTFYQFTRKMDDIISDITLDGLLDNGYSFLGLLGKASSMLPTSYTTVAKIVGDVENPNQEETEICGPYLFNNYGALSKADNWEYIYRSGSFNAPMKQESGISKKHMKIKERMEKMHNKMRSAK